MVAETSAGEGRLTRVQLIALLVALLFLAILAAGLLMRHQGRPESGPAPDFTLQLFDGGTFRLSDQRGKVVVINFWASWCQPCKDEAPDLERTWRRYKDKGVVFVGVNWSDTESKARAYLAEFNITYPNGPDLGRRIGQKYRIQGVPETFFVDRNGNVRKVIIRPMTESELVSIIEQLLAE